MTRLLLSVNLALLMFVFVFLFGVLLIPLTSLGAVLPTTLMAYDHVGCRGALSLAADKVLSVEEEVILSAGLTLDQLIGTGILPNGSYHHLSSNGYYRAIVTRKHQAGNLIVTVRRPVTVRGMPKRLTEFLTSQRNPEESFDTFMGEERRRYKDIIDRQVMWATEQMATRRGWNVDKLRKEAWRFANHSIYIEVQDLEGDHLGTFRVIKAPFGEIISNWSRHSSMVQEIPGTYTRAEAEKLNYPMPKFDEAALVRDRRYGNFGVSVLTEAVIPEALDYYDQLLKFQAEKGDLVVPDYQGFATSQVLLGGENLPDRVLQNWIWKTHAEGRESPVARLMMERLLRPQLEALFPFGLLPRPSFPYRIDRQNDLLLSAGMASEFGNYALSGKVNGQVFVQILFQVFDVMFDFQYTPTFNSYAHRSYTYGNDQSWAMYSALGYKKLLDKPIAYGEFSSDPIWLMYTDLKSFKPNFQNINRTDGGEEKMRQLIQLADEMIRSAPEYQR